MNCFKLCSFQINFWVGTAVSAAPDQPPLPVTKNVRFFRDFNVCKFLALFIRQALPITTNTTETEKGKYQQPNNNLKIYEIYKKLFSHI
jgi:hypothetical protein